MNHYLNKKAIVKKTIGVGIMTLLSRGLGFVRDILVARLFGVGAIADAFFTSIKIPNFFRNILGEGAMSASFVPAFVKSVKDGNKNDPHELMTISFIFFEGIVILLYIFVLLFTPTVIKIIAPGFSQIQINYAVPFLRILFLFLLFISSSALLSGALQSINKFFAPAFGPVLWNITYIITLTLTLSYTLSPLWVCIGCVTGGLIQALFNLYFYLKYKFSFGLVTKRALLLFKNVLAKFLPCLLGVSIVELNLFVGTSIASFLPTGSPSILYYGSRLMNLPLGTFGVAISSILLTHFSRMVLYAPKRLNFYILEVTKVITWVIIPTTIFIMFVSRQIFATLFFSKSTCSPEQMSISGLVLSIYVSGLIFFCLNKVLLNVFYSLKDTKTTTKIILTAAIVNILGDLIGMLTIGIYGIAASLVISGVTLTFSCFYFLHTKYKFDFYLGNYLNFLWRYSIQIIIAVLIFLISYFTIFMFLEKTSWYNFFANNIGYWFIVCPLATIIMLAIFLTRKLCGIELYFLS